VKARSAALLAGLIGIGLTLPAIGPADAASSKVSWSSAKVIRWKDGDTVVTTKGTIRLIGVDTPEDGQCGAAKATRLAKRAAPAGSIVLLGNPKSVIDKDAYNRSLRFVVAKSSAVDIAAKQIRNGSKARYDSRDGYDWHPRQSKYRKLDSAHRNYRCGTSSAPATSDDEYTGCRAYGPNGTSIDDQGRRYTKIDC
jgi:endonuclease YncB( thermonuclease family)